MTGLSAGDLATLSLLDPEQGVCPDGHGCRLDPSAVGRRRCENGEYTGLALIYWDVTREAIDNARLAGAAPAVAAAAVEFLAERRLNS